MESIMQSEKYCFMCGRTDRLEKHHVYHGAFRSKADKYGLWVWLCPECHTQSDRAIHQNRGNELQLKAHGQRVAMAHYGWTKDEFRARFGRNYL